MVRQYGCNTSSASKSTPPTVTYQQNSFVYINGMDGAGGAAGSMAGAPGVVTTSTCSQSFPSLVPIADTSSPIASPIAMGCSSALGTVGGAGLGLCGGATLPRTTASSSAVPMSSAMGQTSSSSSYRGHIVRLNSIDPNTVMFSTKDYPILSDVTVPEIIDELEKQFEDKLSDLQGVRLVANNVYICLSRKESLQHLTTYGFYVRGVPVKVCSLYIIRKYS